jgi:hypothetical protein
VADFTYVPTGTGADHHRGSDHALAALLGTGTRHPQGAAGPDLTERLDLHRLPLRDEPVGDAALIENLDRARVQTA